MKEKMREDERKFHSAPEARRPLDEILAEKAKNAELAAIAEDTAKEKMREDIYTFYTETLVRRVLDGVLAAKLKKLEKALNNLVDE